MADGMVSKITIEMDVNTTKVDNALARTAQSLYAMNQIINFLDPIKDAIVDLGVDSVRTFADFDDTLRKVQATLGVTGEEGARQLQGLRDKAIELGADTKFTSTEIADAFSEMSRAGWEYDQILSGAKGVTDLAIISQMGFGEATDYLIGAMNAFNFTADQSTDFVDIMARSAVKSNLEFNDLAVSFKQVGTYAGGLGYKVEDVSVQLMLMAQRGLKGSRAGTALRRVLTRLYNPTEAGALILKEWGTQLVDAEGNVRPLNTVMDEMRAKFQGLTAEEKAFVATAIAGQTGQEGFMAIMESSQVVATQFAEDLKDVTGATEEMTDIMKQGAGYQIEELTSSFENAKVVIGEIIFKAIQPLIGFLKEMADAFTRLDPNVQKVIVGLGALLVAVTSLGIAFVTIQKGIAIFGLIGSLLGPATALAPAVAGVGSAVGALGAGATVAVPAVAGLGATLAGLVLPILGVVAVVGAIAGVGYLVYKALNDTGEKMDLFADTYAVGTKTITNANGELETSTTYTTEVFSEATKMNVSKFVEMNDKVSKELDLMSFSSKVVTAEMATTITENFAGMNALVVKGFVDQREKTLTELRGMFGDSKALTESEETAILDSITKKNLKKIEETEKYNTAVQNIMKRASDEKRELTEDELKTIQGLQQKMTENAVIALTENEVQAKAILIRMKTNSATLTKETASAYVTELNKMRDDGIRIANEEYEARIEQIIRLRDESGEISAEQADRLIEEAERTRKGTIERVERTRLDSLSEMRRLNEDMYNSVNTHTGQTLTLWEKLKNWWKGWTPEAKTFKSTVNVTESVRRTTSSQGNSTQAYASGASYLKYDQMAQIHKGEAVIPADNNPWNPRAKNPLQTGGGTSGAGVIVQQMIVRNEDDIKRISEELYRLQQREKRGRGI